MEIRFLGVHNCESATSRCATILMDGVIALDAGGLTSGLTFEQQRRIKAVLLTHQHFDHVRDLPLFAMNLFLQGERFELCAAGEVLRAFSSHLMDGELYPDFTKRPEESPTVTFREFPAGTETMIGDYRVLPVEVNHAIPAQGYYVTAPGGESLFYTGDTGPGLGACWRKITPRLLIIEVTAPERYRDSVPGHLTPGLLKQELMVFHELKGYLPKVALVHMNPLLETEIAGEMATVRRELGADIVLASEGMKLKL